MPSNALKYWEHCSNVDVGLQSELGNNVYTTFFPKRRGDDLPCFNLTRSNSGNYLLNTGYFVGVDWLEIGEKAIYVAPKLNTKPEEIDKSDTQEIDFIHMLFSSMRHSDVTKEMDELFLIKWDEENIEIEQKHDLLTPLLVMEFLGVLKHIVRKGLKRSYYKVERNLNGRIKGKIMVGKTIKHNAVQNKQLYTYCTYDEFGLNNKENKLLKKTLSFVKRYLPNYAEVTNADDLQNTFNFIAPAFAEVTEDIQISDVKQVKVNAFYKEYQRALELAKLILRRFGYNISNTSQTVISTPPFWIDMSRLFELYVLGLLKDRFHTNVTYHLTTYGNELDYALNSEEYQMVIDAKYKTAYINGRVHTDIRQVSGYARLEKVHRFMGISDSKEAIDCLIIHPDQNSINMNLINVNFKNEENKIKDYHGIYKVGIKLPVIK